MTKRDYLANLNHIAGNL